MNKYLNNDVTNGKQSWDMKCKRWLGTQDYCALCPRMEEDFILLPVCVVGIETTANEQSVFASMKWNWMISQGILDDFSRGY